MIQAPFRCVVAALLLGLSGAAPAAAPADSQAVIEEAIQLLEDDTLPLDTRLEVATTLVQRHPGLAEGWAVLGELREESGLDEAALAAFRRAVDLDATLHSAWHWIGILEKRLATGPDGHEAALAAFRKALDLGAPKSRGMNEVAVTLVNLGRMDEAHRIWLAALREDPHWGVLYANAANAALNLGRQSEAVRIARDSLGAERFDPRAILVVGNALQADGKQREALELYGEGVRRAPEDPKLRYEFGALLMTIGRTAAAETQLATARSLALASGDEATAAAARLNLFAVQHPRSHERMMRAEALVNEAARPDGYDQRALQRALDLADQVAADHPDLWEALLLRGTALRRMGQADAARVDFQGVLAIQPGQPNALINLAMADRDLGSREAALSRAAEARAAAPRNLFIAVNAAFIHLDFGDCAGARAIRDDLAARFVGMRIEDLLGELDRRLADEGC